MLRLATLTLAVLSSAVPALSKVSCKDPGPSACKQQCSAYRKQRPAPRMFNACLAGCNAGRSVHANCGAACKNQPLPRPTTGQICSQQCSAMNLRIRNCLNQQHRQEKAEKEVVAAQRRQLETITVTEQAEKIVEAATPLKVQAAPAAVPEEEPILAEDEAAALIAAEQAAEAKAKAVADAAAAEA